MSKESESIIDAYHEGENDKRSGKLCINKYKKGSRKRIAYKNGYNCSLVIRKDKNVKKS